MIFSWLLSNAGCSHGLAAIFCAEFEMGTIFVNGGVKMRHLGGVKIHHVLLGSLST